MPDADRRTPDAVRVEAHVQAGVAGRPFARLPFSSATAGG
jgi:hypothetical protein